MSFEFLRFGENGVQQVGRDLDHALENAVSLALQANVTIETLNPGDKLVCLRERVAVQDGYAVVSRDRPSSGGDTTVCESAKLLQEDSPPHIFYRPLDFKAGAMVEVIGMLRVAP